MTMKELYVGVATNQLTPEFEVYLEGYGHREKKSNGISEPIFVSSLALGETLETSVLIITCDLLGIQKDYINKLYLLIETSYGIAYPNVLISCSHTHFAPITNVNYFNKLAGIIEPDPKWLNLFEQALLKTIGQSIDNMEKVIMRTVRVNCPSVLYNRRTVYKNEKNVTTKYLYPEDWKNYQFSPVDDQVSVLRFSGNDKDKAILVNFGCHPVTGDEEFYHISSDYPYYVRNTISQKFKCETLFTLGTAGDTVPMNRGGECRKQIAQVIGNSILLAGRAWTTEKSPAIRTDYIELTLKTVSDKTPAQAKKEYEEKLAEYQKALPGNKENPTMEKLRSELNRTALEYLNARYYDPVKKKNRIRIQFIKIGETVLVAWPFEVLSNFSIKMKKEYPDTILVSCAGGYEGYIYLAEDYYLGGSEINKIFVPDSGDMILKETLKRIRILKAK